MSLSSATASPAPAEPLRQYGRLRTADVAVAQKVVAEVYEPHILDPVNRTRLDARLNAVQTGSLTLGYLTYGTETRITLPPNERWYHVNITLAGSSRVSREDGHRGTTAGMCSAAILLPHRSQHIDWDANAAQFALKVPRADLEGQLAGLARKQVAEPIDFDLVVNLTTPAGRGLLRCVDFVRTEWDENGILAQNADSRRHLEAMILTNLLAAATGPHQRLLQNAADMPKPAALQRALDHIHDHIRDLPTLTDLTAAAGVSARTLQCHFLREIGCTPLQYLRDLRLRGARDALVHPRSAELMVSAVATDWGFFNFGRFASLYRSVYDETPSATLRRALGADRALPSA
ncbi:AraC family transcriptional regulator [Pseudonocardia asaccharolytica]|uniref:Transcriptional regulator n=1 Tax=Pseudonocardia asaccharolytica DSM 44247 = NBRC 16224 TaxID=1123024 RepID=A0A511D7B9_9PSEU|nr:AraC family transcriptional regulator [Pseudonocardia asaccharolytica]GEL20690.1 transcriptional regulator [Pseudonocardia asaccharolytica DSM 44247 = NBRC 16224]